MGSGDPKKGVMILGEAPGENEARTGRVFSGRAGQVLDLALERAGLARESVYVSNVVKCRPEDNATPDRVHWESCRKYLERELRHVKPHHVLLLGNTALRAVAKKSGITKHRGVRLDVRDPHLAGVTVMATVHPAYVLRNPGQSATFQEDIRRFARAMRGEFRVSTVRTTYIKSASGLRKLRRLLEQAETVSYDVENRYEPWHPDWAIVCLGVTVDGQRSYVVPLCHPQSPFRRRWLDVLRYLKPALERPGLRLIAQNGKHDNKQLAGAGIYLEHRFDIMLAAHLLDENRPKNLGFLSQAILGADEYKGMVELKPDKIMKSDLTQMVRYNGNDVGYTFQLYKPLRDELLEHPRLTRLMTKLMMPASHMMQKVEYQGAYINRKRLLNRLGRLNELIEERLEVMRDGLPEDIRESFNFNSTQQLGRWLFSSRSAGGLGLSPLEVTKSGNPSTREAVLLHYAGSTPEVRALLQYRTLELKWRRTYFEPWLGRLDARSRLHTTYKLYGTVTGRLSGDLQQVPRDDFIRGVFGAPPGWAFISADYSQIELRIAAMVSGDRTMRDAYLTGQDLHLKMAAQLTGKLPQDVTKEERKMAKAVNFGFLFGMGHMKFLAYAFENYGLKITEHEAKAARDSFFRTFPGLLKWHDRQRRVVNATQRVQSPIGRVRHLPDVLSGDRMVKAEAERQAINSPVQSCATDMMLFAMTKLDQALDPRECFMTMTLHDGINFECKEEKVDKWTPVIKEVMETLPLRKTFGWAPDLPIIADVEVGKYWQGIPDASGLGVLA